MLIKGNDVLNLKVVTIDTGSFIEDVDDIIYDPSSHKMRAFLVDKGGWFSDAKVLLFEDVKHIGTDAIIIESANRLKKAAHVDGKVAHITKNDTYLTKTKIITEEGKDLGTITDILFDDKTGDVMELEVSEGGLKTMTSGKKRVKVTDIITIGEDATIVKAYTEKIFDQQAEKQGLQGAYNKSADKTKETFHNTKNMKDDPKTQERMQNAKIQTKDTLNKVGGRIFEFNQKMQNKFQDMKQDPKNQNKLENIKQKTKELSQNTKQKAKDTQKDYKNKQKEDAAGKYLTVNVLAPSEEKKIIAKRGDMITYRMLNQAEKEGVLNKILNNTSPEPIAQNQQLRS